MSMLINAKWSVMLMLLWSMLGGCATVNIMKNGQKQISFGEISLHQRKDLDAQAVVVLLHGLNLKPQKMDDWSQYLSDHGAQVIRFGLYGHDPDRENMADASAQIWRKQFKEAAELAQKKAKALDVPLYFVGFSLGALVALESLATENIDKNIFEKMVLIAPAISVPWYAKMAIGALRVCGRGLFLPSRSPKGYRANRGTSIAAYQALFELKSSLERRNYQNVDVESLVLIDRHDELVDSGAIMRLIDRHRLSHWRLRLVDNSFAHDNYGFRHLIVDEQTVGKELWMRITDMVTSHLFCKK